VCNANEAELILDKPSNLTFQLHLEQLVDFRDETAAVDQQILDAILDNEGPEEELEEVNLWIEEYVTKIWKARLKITQFMNCDKPASPNGSVGNTARSEISSETKKKRGNKLTKI